MPFYDRGDVRIHYEEAGSGFPLLVIPGGGVELEQSPASQPARSKPNGRSSRTGTVCRLRGSAERQWRLFLRPARHRPDLGRLHR